MILQLKLTQLLRLTALSVISISSCTLAADKFPSYGALSFFGANKQASICGSVNSLASMRLARRDTYYAAPKLLATTSTARSEQFVFRIDQTDEFSVQRELREAAIESWRSFPSLSAGRYEFSSMQQLSDGSMRLSDALVMNVPPVRCAQLSSVGVASGDMQVAAVGRPFPINPIRVQVRATTTEGAAETSVALASKPIFNEAGDTRMNGPLEAVSIGPSGSADFLLSPGNRAGVKRFIVKARNAGTVGSVSAILTLLHVPAGSPDRSSTPIIEYSYDGGGRSEGRYLSSTTDATSLLDSLTTTAFMRTGQVWRAFTSADAAPGLSPVCQFFGATGVGTVTHFFTADASECAQQRANTGSQRLNFEGIAFFAVPPIADSCPAAFPIAVVRYKATAPALQYRYAVSPVGTSAPLTSPTGFARERIAFCTDVAATE